MREDPDAYVDDNVPLFRDEELHQIFPRAISPAVASEPPPRSPRVRRRRSPPDLAVLSVYPKHNTRDPDLNLEDSPSVDCEMTEPSEEPEPDGSAVRTEASATTAGPSSGIVSAQSPLPKENASLRETAALAVERVDSKNNSEEAVPHISPEKRRDLKVQTDNQNHVSAPPVVVGESMTSSPTLQKYMIHPDQSKADNLPAVQSSNAPGSDLATSPRKTSEPLPPVQEILASVAAHKQQEDSRVQPHVQQHKLSFSSTTSQSPRLPYPPPFSGSAQTSPVSFATPSGIARSPTSTIGEAQYYGSPYAQQAQYHMYYPGRRSSTVTESQQGLTPHAPSLPSASSSESHGNASSSTDGTSTTQTTPIDSTAMVDGTPRPILPPPPAMINANAVSIFKCDFDGCSAPPFQTQYLLSSHKNVHSSSRPHYCPVPDCPRSENGKGFKRKNEMIRHGLVHNSPGYVCPFCPDRDHKYPRPDNLQRHVRVHHVDKDKDDPLLRDVLGQRPEGVSQKQRRRRTQSTATAPEPPAAAS